jgi:hypothetical protein
VAVSCHSRPNQFSPAFTPSCLFSSSSPCSNFTGTFHIAQTHSYNATKYKVRGQPGAVLFCALDALCGHAEGLPAAALARIRKLSALSAKSDQGQFKDQMTEIAQRMVLHALCVFDAAAMRDVAAATIAGRAPPCAQWTARGRRFETSWILRVDKLTPLIWQLLQSLNWLEVDMQLLPRAQTGRDCQFYLVIAWHLRNDGHRVPVGVNIFAHSVDPSVSSGANDCVFGHFTYVDEKTRVRGPNCNVTCMHCFALL